MADRQKELFDRGLKNAIDSFERAKEWADLSNCLQKAKQQIEKNKELPIPRQRDLAKRLAQCLNPEINVIHQLTLEVYKEVFEREIKLMKQEQKEDTVDIFARKSSVALFFSGLFNFYQFAAFEVKQTFLEIISSYLLKMKKELILSLPGFMLCMLPALEEQNGEILKRVEKILGETEKIVGTSEFYGEIWKAMLRTPRARLPAIKYMDKKIPRTLQHAKEYASKNKIFVADFTIRIINHEVVVVKDEEKIQKFTERLQKMGLEDYMYFYYPNKNQLVINSLVSGLQLTESSQQNNMQYVHRATLDFLISHMPLRDEQFNSLEEKIRLVESASLTYTNRDFATLNKLQHWIFEQFDEEEEIDPQDSTVIAIVESQKNLFRLNMDPEISTTMNLKKTNLIGPNQQTQPRMVPILILLRIMSDEHGITVPVLRKISVHLIKFIKYHLPSGYATKSLQINDTKFIVALRNYLEQILHQYHAVLDSLAKQLNQVIENSQLDQALYRDTIDVISYAIFDMKNLYSQILDTPQSRLKLTEILSTMLTGLKSISELNNSMELTLPTLEVVERILDTFQYMEIEGQITLINQKGNEKFKKAIESFNELYVQMCQNMIKQAQINNEDYKLFKKYNDIMFKVLLLQDIDHNSIQMPEWLGMLIKCSKFESTQICLVAVDVFVKILQMPYDERVVNFVDSKKPNEKNSAILNIQKLIAVQNTASKFKKTKNAQDFRKEFLRQLQVNQEGKNPETKLIIQNLWSQLDKEIDTQKIVNHLKELDCIVPNIFSDVVIQDLNQEGLDSQGTSQTRQRQGQAIKKFSIFWKNTQKLYPDYKPFELAEDTNRKKYCALHNMINFLEHTDPTLRLQCRSWLSQNNKQYNRILDPIIEEFIHNSKFVQKPNSDKMYIESKFETQYVIENFSKLRNIILNTQGEIIDYMIHYKAHHFIAHIFEENKNRIVGNVHQPINDQHQIVSNPQNPVVPEYTKKAYLDMLVEITLNYIQAEYTTEFKQRRDQMSVENQLAETLTVNASACEFMELILKQVQRDTQFKSDPDVSYRIAHKIIKPLINTFNSVIENENYAMMVNIINLLDLILNHCNFQRNNKNQQSVSKEYIDPKLVRQKCEEIFIFKNKIFLQSIKDGLTSNLSFVRQKFIQFVEMLIPYMRKFAKENETFKETYKAYVSDLIEIFCQILRKADVTMFSTGYQQDDFHNQVNPDQKRSSMNLPDDKQQCDEKWQQALKKLVINQESDIIQVIGGLQVIVTTVLDIKSHDGMTLQEIENELAIEDDLLIKNTKADQNKNQGFLGGLFSGGDQPGYFAGDVFTDVKTVVYEKLSAIIISCIYTWNQLPLLALTDYHFTRYGMFAYSQDDFKKINEEIKNQRSKESDIAKLTFEKLLQSSINPIQKRIIQLLRPIAKKIPDQYIEGTLNVWLHKSLLKGTNEDRSYQKIIQMLICVYQAQDNQKNNKIDYIMPVYKVIDSIIKYIQEQEAKNVILVHQKKWTKNSNPLLNIRQSQSETLLCQFLFSYLVYNPTMYDPLFDIRSEDKSKEFHKVYVTILKFFNLFKFSRNPFTICWLLEIINILCLKFKQEDAKLDNRLRKEYLELFNNMLANCAQILTESFNIKFDLNQQYQLSLPPTVYELLFRYEYMQFKHQKEGLFQKDWEDKEVDAKRSFSLIQNQAQDFKNLPSDQVGLIDLNGSPFFGDQQLERLVAKKFEYLHSDHSQSIFKNMEILMKDRGNLSDEYLNQSNFMEDIKFALRGQDEYTTPEKFLIHTKYYVIITLKQILCNILQNLIGNTDLEKTNKSLQIVFSKSIELLQQDKKNDKKKDKTQEVMIEFITEFFASIVEKTHKQINSELIKPYRRDIIDLFNNENFFKVNLLNLKQWQKIMSNFIDGKPEEIMQEQMQLWNFQGGLFANNNTVIVQKCYAMKRIAFLIFSSKEDDFQKQLDSLMKKMIEVFKQKQKNDIKQRLFLFFLTRVMLIRLNTQALTDALRKLWPHLLNELISVFEKDDNLDKDNTEMTIEAIKLVELLSSLNIEDFQMNQWIFLIDGYGMKLESKKHGESQKKKNSNQIQQMQTKMNTKKQSVGEENVEVFKTFIVKFIGDQEYSFYNVNDPVINGQQQQDEYQPKTEEPFVGRNPQSISVSNQDNQSTLNTQGTELTRLQEQAANLQQSINDSNVIGNEFNKKGAEAKIEIDFLRTDEMLQNK